MKPSTRIEVAKQFGISLDTFDSLIKRGFMEPEIVHAAGRSLYSFNEEEDFPVMACGRNWYPSFSGRIFPFQRFLFLRFLTTPLGLILDEILDSKILYRITDDVEEDIEIARRIFIKNLPYVLRKPVEKSEPINESLSEVLDLVLNILDISIFYHKPEITERCITRFEPKLKIEVDNMLTSLASSEEISLFIEEILEVKEVFPEEIEAYRSLIHDVSFMSEGDFKKYFSTIHPTYREIRTKMRDRTLEQVHIEAGITRSREEDDKFLKRAQQLSSSMFMNQMQLGSPKAMAQAEKALSMLLKVSEARDKISDSTSKLDTFFDLLELSTDKHAHIETAAEISLRERKIAGVDDV